MNAKLLAEVKTARQRAGDMTRQRDEAKAEVERLKAALEGHTSIVVEARAEVERLRAALDTANATNRELLSQRNNHLAALTRAREALRGVVYSGTCSCHLSASPVCRFHEAERAARAVLAEES